MGRFSIGFSLMLMLTSAALSQPHWQMERRDRFGSAQQPVGPSTYTLPWIKAKVATEVNSHGPAIGSLGLLYYGSWIDTKVRRVRMDTFATEATFTALNFVQSTPALSSDESLLFVHAARNFSQDPPGRLFRLSTTSMDFDWVFQTDCDKFSEWESISPIVGPDGDVVIGSTNGRVWRIDEVTGIPVWTKSGLTPIRHTAAFLRDDSAVVVSTDAGVTCIDYATGATRWTAAFGQRASGVGVAANGTVVVGSDGAAIYGINPANGATLWTRQTLGIVRPAPAFDPTGTVAYVCSDDWRLYAIRVSDGVRLWSYTGSHENRNAPSVGADGRIYFGNRVGWFYCVKPDGLLAWSINFNGQFSGAEFRGPLTIGTDGTLYLATTGYNQGLIALSQQPSKISLSSFAVTSGALVSGILPNIIESDDSYVIAAYGSSASDTLPFAQIQVNATSPTRAAHRIKIDVEASCVNAVQQRLRLFNFSTNSWDTVDLRPATFVDSVATYQTTSNVARFIHQTTKEVRVDIRWGSDSVDGLVVGKLDQLRIETEPAFEN